MDLELLQRIATETLADGRLVMTPERLSYVLQVDPATTKSLMDSGELPVLYLDHLGKRFPRVVAEDVLDLVRRRSTHSMLRTKGAVRGSEND